MILTSVEIVNLEVGSCLYSLYTGTTYYTNIYSRRQIQITGVSCYGNEYRLTDCDYTMNKFGECQYDDIGVTCSPGIYTSITPVFLYKTLYAYIIITCISCYTI